MTAEEAAIFPYVFADTYVVDLDFSTWQRSVSLYLTADYASEHRRYYPEIFLVEFLRVRQWEIAFNHFDSDNADEEKEHFYWEITRYEAQPAPRGMQFTFWSREDHPRMTIACEQVLIRELPRVIIEQIQPTRTGRRTFLRPSIDQLARGFDR